MTVNLDGIKWADALSDIARMHITVDVKKTSSTYSLILNY